MKRSERYREFRTKILQKKAVIGIIGVGTIGECLGKAVSRAGFTVIGFDINDKKVKEINLRFGQSFRATTDFSGISQCEIIVICVPTPVTQQKKPDLTYIKKAAQSITHYSGTHHLVLLESSVSVGATRTLVARLLSKKAKTEWFIGYSPERIDPGNKTYTITNTPKLVSGIDKESLALTKLFYSHFIDKLVVVSSLEAAELAKLFENTFRLVNISLVHELSSFAKRAGLDIWEIIDLAKTKPFGFLPHYPSIGVGGHCIPVDPYYLVDDARKFRMKLPIVTRALQRNTLRPKEIVEILEQVIKGKKKNKTILIIGITYKKNCADIRESAVTYIMKLLKNKNWNVLYHDPFVSTFDQKHSVDLNLKTINSVDGVLLAVAHKKIDFSVFKHAQIPIIDTTHSLKNSKNRSIVFI